VFHASPLNGDNSHHHPSMMRHCRANSTKSLCADWKKNSEPLSRLTRRIDKTTTLCKPYANMYLPMMLAASSFDTHIAEWTSGRMTFQWRPHGYLDIVGCVSLDEWGGYRAKP